MNIEQIRDDLATDLYAVHEIISTILDSYPGVGAEHLAIDCNDNARALLEYALGYADSAFQHIDQLSVE